ncbi:hypothetical protein LOZ53_002621 [Ophidiomyces ophidiicola]|nr:hypothetical protein LOZ55_002753 [Ophidiomyces ophidiicola]KAI1992170.1 hypothetical protein LOZ53_002621 [Ophidiomyces ophidiicola]KAI1994186.1 hypothetical protein LOZ54_001030 [Ophidiomyces ophidiicola]KAI2003054.1 hypothetical protein LOZ51_000127 [Ophidiomyces ophidiicola]
MSDIVGLTAKDIIMQPISTYWGSAFSADEKDEQTVPGFPGIILKWINFENEVKENFRNISWENYPTVLAYRPSGNATNLKIPDHFICGSRVSILNRWVEHALRPVSAVGRVMGFGTVFGDWKATNRSFFRFSGNYQGNSTIQSPYPDLALIVESNREPRMIGMVEAPWDYNFQEIWGSFAHAHSAAPIEQVLGMYYFCDSVLLFNLPKNQHLARISTYMIELGLIYGFLTNYDYTFFLKRSPIGSEEVIYCSKPISHTASQLTGDAISVRQALMFLQCSVQGEESSWYAKSVPRNLVAGGQEVVIPEQLSELPEEFPPDDRWIEDWINFEAHIQEYGLCESP